MVFQTELHARQLGIGHDPKVGVHQPHLRTLWVRFHAWAAESTIQSRAHSPADTVLYTQWREPKLSQICLCTVRGTLEVEGTRCAGATRWTPLRVACRRVQVLLQHCIPFTLSVSFALWTRRKNSSFHVGFRVFCLTDERTGVPGMSLTPSTTIRR